MYGLNQKRAVGKRGDFVRVSVDELLHRIQESQDSGVCAVALWEGPTWRKADNATADEHGTAMTWAFSPDGRNLAVGTSQGYVKLRRLSR